MRILLVTLVWWAAEGLLTGQTPVPAAEAVQIETVMAAGKRLFSANVEIRRGFDQGAKLKSAPVESVATDATGISRTSTRQWERIEVQLPRSSAAEYLGCLWVDSKCQSLPVGSSIDKTSGIFYWHVPNAFKGDFDLVFFQAGSSPLALRVCAGSDITARLN